MYLFTALDQYTSEEQGLITDDTFWFELPDCMSKDIKYVPNEDEREAMLEDVPEIIVTSIIEAMEEQCPISTFNTLYYLFRGWLAVYFVRKQLGSRAAMKTKFFKALHFIEALRERVYHPEWYLHQNNQYAKYSSRSKSNPNLVAEPAKKPAKNPVKKPAKTMPAPTEPEKAKSPEKEKAKSLEQAKSPELEKEKLPEKLPEQEKAKSPKQEKDKSPPKSQD